MSLHEFTLMTDKEGLIDITEQVKSAVEKSMVQDGICLVFCPHTTTGITLSEKVDPDVGLDFLTSFKRALPDMTNFLHKGGNSFAHVRSIALGCSQSVIVKNGNLLLGEWQGIFFCEFDGPRERKFYVKVM